MRTLLVLAFSLALVACGKKVVEPAPTTPPPIEAEEVEVETETTEPPVVETETVPEEAPAPVVPEGLDAEGDENLNVIRPRTLALEDFAEGDPLSSPLELNGKIRRDWVFEGSFPMSILTDQESIIAQGYGTADWLEPLEDEVELSGDDLIHFEATIEFEVPLEGAAGKIRFVKDNASGLPENDDYIDVMVLWP